MYQDLENIFVLFQLFMTRLLKNSPTSRTTIPGQPLGLSQKYGCLGKTMLIQHHL